MTHAVTRESAQDALTQNFTVCCLAVPCAPAIPHGSTKVINARTRSHIAMFGTYQWLLDILEQVCARDVRIARVKRLLLGVAVQPAARLRRLKVLRVVRLL